MSTNFLERMSMVNRYSLILERLQTFAVFIFLLNITDRSWGFCTGWPWVLGTSSPGLKRGMCVQCKYTWVTHRHSVVQRPETWSSWQFVTFFGFLWAQMHSTLLFLVHKLCDHCPSWVVCALYVGNKILYVITWWNLPCVFIYLCIYVRKEDRPSLDLYRCLRQSAVTCACQSNKMKIRVGLTFPNGSTNSYTCVLQCRLSGCADLHWKYKDLLPGALGQILIYRALQSQC